ncbi:zinc-dependent alcohol dehydrogenase [Roseicella aquatilis]|nr:alcohol dehydrogenase catalytic domain-containing protein [Roseicella aquatilis]
MRALVLEGPRRLSARSVPMPRPAPGGVLVTVELAGLGGSECAGYAAPGIRPVPSIMGHGIIGTVADGRRVAVNPLRSCRQCRDCRSGQPQRCAAWSMIGVQTDGGCAQAVAVPEDALEELPGDLTWEQAAFAEPFANAVHAWELAGNPRDRIAILGAGGLGLGLVVCAAVTHSESITIADLSANRLAAAVALGATETGTAIAGHYDFVFDTVGSAETRRAALELTRPGGTCILLGFAAPLLEIEAGRFIRSERRLLGSFAYSDREFRSGLELAARCSPDWVESLAFDEVEPFLKRCLAGDFSIVKAVLRPNR